MAVFLVVETMHRESMNLEVYWSSSSAIKQRSPVQISTLHCPPCKVPLHQILAQASATHLVDDWNVDLQPGIDWLVVAVNHIRQAVVLKGLHQDLILNLDNSRGHRRGGGRLTGPRQPLLRWQQSCPQGVEALLLTLLRRGTSNV